MAVSLTGFREALKALTLHRCFVAGVDPCLVLATALTLIGVMNFIELSRLLELIKFLLRVLLSVLGNIRVY